MAITPSTFDPLKTYIAVRLQQGVPIVDADENEREDIRRFEVRAFLKWFVGSGIPDGNDGFRIVPSSTSADNFRISKGITIPTGITPGSIEEGLNYVGRCLVDGLDVLIRNDLEFTAQRLHEDNPASTTEQTKLGVPKITRLPNANTTIVVYLDVWERDVDHNEDTSLVLPGLGVPSCARVKREWVVRVRNPGATSLVPQSSDPDYLPKHSYYALATIVRRAGISAVTAADITDLREQKLLMLPATLMTDLFGISALDYRRGQGRPPISYRDTINALLRGELPATPDRAIAPDTFLDFMSYAFTFEPSGSAIAMWHSNRVGATNQVFASRWEATNPAIGFSAPPQQITTGAQAHALPQSVMLPTGDLLVVYETAQQTIHFKRAPFNGLGAIAEQLVPTIATGNKRHPFVVISGTQVVFFWHQDTPNPRWMYRRRQYPATWVETGATWVDATEQELSPINAAPPSVSVGDFHAVTDSAGDVWIAFRTQADDIQAIRLTPSTGAIATPASPFATAALDQEPFVVVDGTTSVWFFWRSDAGVFYQRAIKGATLTWDAAATLVPDTNVGAANTNTRPCAMRDGDGAIWLFWVSQRSSAGNNDIWVTRRNPLTTGWGQVRQITGSPADDTQPFAAIAPNGVLWLFWRSNRSANYDLYFKQIVTAI